MKTFTRVEKHMGCTFEFILRHQEAAFADTMLGKATAEMQRLEALMSEYLPDSEISRINTYAAQNPVIVSTELFELLQRCMALYKLSKGAFDISTRPLKQLYRFKNTTAPLPDAKALQATLACTGYAKVLLNEQAKTVFFKQPGMQLSLAAIGKGYAADRVAAMWQAAGVEHGLINASGDLCAWGEAEPGVAWQAGIPDPLNPEVLILFLPLTDKSIATSGDYEQHFMLNGKRYSHTISPFTGLPLENTGSVSVIAPAAELADALATAVSVLGKKEGMELINRMNNCHALLIDHEGNLSTSAQISLSENATI